MQVTNHSNNKRNMKEELLEAIYGTVERLEQKVDELSDSTKNAGAETVLSPASVDTSKLEKAILSALNCSINQKTHNNMSINVFPLSHQPWATWRHAC